MPTRRCALALPLLALGAPAHPAERRALAFPRDHGSHPQARIEWWYITGALESAHGTCGFQITFFRWRSEVAADHPSAFAARQLLFAHAAVSEVSRAKLRHEQRIARAGFGIAEAATDDTRLKLRDWSLVRTASGAYDARARAETAGFAYRLLLKPTQPLLLQGDSGFSRKGPRPEQGSLYVSEPQLDAGGTLTLGARDEPVRGRAWLDHEWSDQYMDEGAVGWDWIGMNLDDGSALMAFRMRRPDGSALWAGGSFRGPDAATRSFGPGDLRFVPGRVWTSPATQARYPVQWVVETPAGRFEVRALFDSQELDSRQSTGAVYWEGLSDLLDEKGRRVGRGYLEMTGYAARLRV